MASSSSTLEMLKHVCSTTCERGAGLMRRFAADRSGAIVLLFGLTLVLILGFVGGAIDYANAYRYRAKIQNALDSAALAAGREIDVGSSNSTAKQVAQDVFKANLGPGYVSSASMDLDIDDGVVTANAGLNVDTQILGVLGISQFPVGATSKVNVSGGTFEVALVLDNSGSMSGSRISDLKTASVSLTDILFGAETTSNRVSMSVVPFSASVNVGTQYSTAAWMDQTGQSSIHKEHFDSNVTRWQMFSALNNVS